MTRIVIHNEAGFTLMEVLLTVAIILALGSVLAVAAHTALTGAAQSFKAVQTAVTLTRIDRYIRAKTDALHIPWWADPAPYIDALESGLFRSDFGTYIGSIDTIRDWRGSPRGIEVVYTVHDHVSRTIALFPSAVLMEPAQ